MVVKPFAFVAVAALVVVAAGTGAFLAVRQDPAPAVGAPPTAVSADPALPGAPVLDDALMHRPIVEATEQLIEETADTAFDARRASTETPVALTEPRPRRREEAPAPAPAPPPVERVPIETAPTAETTGGRNDLPSVDGWEKLDAPWPSRGDTADEERFDEPPRVALAVVNAGRLGLGLDPEPRPRVFEELEIAADSVIGLQIDTPVSTEYAEVEDEVAARVTRDVLVADRVAVPAGTEMLGSVVLVEQGGQIKGASRLGVRFHTIVMDDGARVPIVTETVYREGRARGGESAAKIGGAAVGGAILGAIFGGGRGAAIGGAAGAAGGTAAAMAGDAEPAQFPAGVTVTVRLSQPTIVTVER